MKNVHGIGVLAMLLFAGVASAQSTTSPQGGTAIYKGVVKCASTGALPADQTGLLAPPCVDSANEGQWITVMNASLKASTNKTLFVSPSLVTGLYTNTQVKGSNNTTPTSQTATAVASVVLMNAFAAIPSGARALPALKPYQPTQSKPVPTMQSTMLCGAMISFLNPSRCPRRIHKTSADHPELM